MRWLFQIEIECKICHRATVENMIHLEKMKICLYICLQFQWWRNQTPNTLSFFPSFPYLILFLSFALEAETYLFSSSITRNVASSEQMIVSFLRINLSFWKSPRLMSPDVYWVSMEKSDIKMKKGRKWTSFFLLCTFKECKCESASFRGWIFLERQRGRIIRVGMPMLQDLQ